MTEPLITAAELAERLGLAAGTILDWFEAGKLPGSSSAAPSASAGRRLRRGLAGIAHRTPYALRHTYASLAIAAGVSLFELSRLMGTSPAILDATYGHLLPGALDRSRAALDTFVARAAEAAEGGTR